MVSVLGNQPLVLLHAVDGDKGYQDRYGPDIFLVYRVVSICPVLADLKSSGSAEHNVDDPDIAGQGRDPLEGAL